MKRQIVDVVRRLVGFPAIMARLERIEANANTARAVSELKSISDGIAKLEQRIATLEAHQQHESRIDLVMFQGMPLFLYIDDLAYTAIDDANKCSPRREAPGRFLQRASSGNRDLLEGSTVGLCLDFLFEAFENVAIFDVGCQYGTSSINLAYHLRSRGRSAAIFAFDPGDAGKLVPHNLVLNGVEDLVSFHPIAVSNWTGMTLIYSEAGNTENNRIGNPINNGATLSRPAPVTTVDDFVAEHKLDGPAFIKIDTQGFDYEVVLGAIELIQRQAVVIHTEFTPHAMGNRVDPVEFLGLLCRDFHVLDEAALEQGPIPENALEETVAAIEDRKPPYTDLVCVSKLVPDGEKLVERLKSAKKSKLGIV